MCFPFALGAEMATIKTKCATCGLHTQQAVRGEPTNTHTHTQTQTHTQTNTYTPARSRENESTSDLLLGNEMIALTVYERHRQKAWLCSWLFREEKDL